MAQRNGGELRKVIQQALLEEWDPIGVNEFPEARDEYDGYVGPVLELVLRHSSVEEIFKYLWWVRIPAKPIGHSGRCRSPVPARRSPGA
jgi:hypothetical protein